MQHLPVKIAIREDLNYSAKDSRHKDNILQVVGGINAAKFLGWKSVQSVYHNFADLLPKSPEFPSNLGQVKNKTDGLQKMQQQRISVNIELANMTAIKYLSVKTMSIGVKIHLKAEIRYFFGLREV